MIATQGCAARCLHPARVCRGWKKGVLGSLSGEWTLSRWHSKGVSVEGEGLSPLRAGHLTRAHTIIVASVNLSSFKLNKCFTALWVRRNLCCQGDCSCNSYSELFTLISPITLVALQAPKCQIMMLMESLYWICWFFLVKEILLVGRIRKMHFEPLWRTSNDDNQQSGRRET